MTLERLFATLTSVAAGVPLAFSVGAIAALLISSVMPRGVRHLLVRLAAVAALLSIGVQPIVASLTTVTVWTPAPGTNLQWQLTTPVDQSVNAQVYDIDLFDNSAAVVSSLHARGRHVICYVSAGSFEAWRPDAASFPDVVKGESNGSPGVKWLDIRRIDILGPILEARFDLCRQKGFDAVEPDNVDGYTNKTGFPLSYQDQLVFNRFLANAAHARGLSVGLKNDVEQIPDLIASFDWTLNEQCFQYNECATLTPFVAAGKAVFEVEYKLQTTQFCPQANAMNFDAQKKSTKLDASSVQCRNVALAVTPAPTPVATLVPSPATTATPTVAPTRTPAPTATLALTPSPTAVTTPVPTVAPTPVPTVAPTPVPRPTPAPAGMWRPAANTSWQWQLTTPVDQSVAVQMYDIDLFENDATVVASLHAQGRKVICYMEVGAWESYRPDASSYPASILGNTMGGYPDERYVDIRSPLLRPLIQARLDLCKQKGFDGIEPDIDDRYTEKTGFPLTMNDQIAFDTWVATEAHDRGLSIALKNGVGIAVALQPVFDYTLNEQCFEYSECAPLSAFTNAGKAVFQVEYTLATGSFCAQANSLNFNSLKKKTSLDAYRVACR